MLPLLHRWRYCWKCEFDSDIKIKNYPHDGENFGFYKKIHIKIQSKENDVLVLKRTSTSNGTFNMKEVDLDES